ncbi:(2Fe-2S)-binding protein [Roseibium sp. SCPC15]|jgi:isoquinoline 1-oxidoreductase alpha subunit|uniref:(2Fe-2S)-binding protein n=1 Tax=Roseibium sp. SCP15 TaxID=3141376 RepID=UPI00333D8DD5
MTTLIINDVHHDVDAPGDMPLLWVIRDLAGLTGTKFGCGAGLCGACTVHLNGVAVRSCQTSLDDAADSTVITIEHVGTTDIGAQVQAAWQDIDVPQCGYCQPGQIMSAVALLSNSPTPDDAAIDAAMAGNLCRCGTYARIRAAIVAAAQA